MKTKENTKKILITGGDPAGIGPEIIEKALKENLKTQSNLIIIYFNTSNLLHKENLKKICLECDTFFESVDDFNFEALIKMKEDKNLQNNSGIDSKTKTKTNNLFIYFDIISFLLKTKKDPFLLKNTNTTITIGSPSALSGYLSFQALVLSCDYALKNSCDGLLTAPLSKECVIKSGQSDFRGHTDYLAERFNSNVLMLLHGEKLSAIPLTVHIPLNEVSKKLESAVSDSSVSKLIPLLNIIKELPSYKNTKWALCALNPHAGEGGHLGNEEVAYLENFSVKLKNAGLPITSPIASDALFMSPNREKYRLFFSCYHDQGLIPFKALEGEKGINCTIGLPFPRTSPDHGTAFEIAGKNLASAASMSYAFKNLIENINKN